MILYIYMALGIAAGVAVPFATKMIGSFCDIWKILVAAVVFYALLIILHLLVIVVLSLFVDKKKETSNLKTGVRTAVLVTLDGFLNFIGADIVVSGREKLPDEPFMMVCNHRSLLDAVASVVVFKDKLLTFVSKKENMKIPVIGRYMAELGCLFLDRENNRSAIAIINRAAEMIKTNIASVAICPEGTRNKTKELLLPFHPGSFKIAQKAKCPVVVATVWGTDALKKCPVFKRSKLYIDIVEVLSAEKVAEFRTNELAECARELMYNNLERYK